MSDEDFQSRVLGMLTGLGQRMEAVDRRLDGMDRRLDGMDGRFDAIVARLDEQDKGSDLLTAKVDRMAVAVRNSLEASEQALSAITPLSRRVWRLENPDG